jgi:hypothetical protein
MLSYQETTMDNKRVEYKGYVILPKLSGGGGGRWYGGYEISKGGTTIRARENIFPGFFYSDAACGDSIEHAKSEIDNLVATEG